MKKLLVLILALCMCITGVACAKKSDGGKTTTTSGAYTDSDGQVVEKDPYAHLPEPEDYNLRDFRIGTKTSSGAEYDQMEVLCTDETSTELRDNAVLLRNQAVEDLYNIVIKPIVHGGKEGQQIQQIRTLMATQTDAFDIGMPYVFESAEIATSGWAYNWNTLNYNDLSKTFWMNNVNNKFAVKDAIYLAVGKMCVSTITNTNAMYYNRTKGDDKGITDDVFATIRSGDWTYDYFYNLISNMHDDIDDVTGRSADDFYGFRGETVTTLDNYHFAWDLPMIANDPETGLTDVYMSEKLSAAVQKLNDLYHETTGSYVTYYWDMECNFRDGKAMFAVAWLTTALNVLPKMEDVYTILPLPKYNDEQETYLTGAQDNYSVLFVPYTVKAKDLDFVSIITESLNIESEKTLYPAYYYDALQRKYVSDPDTIEMLDYVLNNVTFDASVILHSELKLATMLRQCVAAKNDDIQRAYDERADEIADSLEYIMEQFDDFKD